MKNLHKILLSLILFIAFLLRFVSLDTTPNGFHADEASFYVNAISIAKTGADEDGNKYPLSLSSYIDPKPALYSYFQIPFISTLDNQILASRLPAIILSMLSLVLIYLLIREVANKNIALVTLAVLSISPWHIVVSRGTQEVISSFFFLCLSSYFLLRLFTKKDRFVLNIAIFLISSLLSMYLYHSAKVLLPLITVGLIIFYFKQSKTYIKKSLLIFLTIIIAVVGSLLIQESSSRISAVGILNDKHPQALLIEQIYTLHEELPINLVRIYYNKFQAYGSAIATQYLGYFSPDFLFLKGGKPYRYLVPDHGLMYLIELPLLLLGLYYAIKNKRKELLLFIGIIILSPIPAALTNQETPSIIRAFPMVIGLAYFTSMGLLEIFKLKNNLFKILILLTLFSFYIWQIIYFSIQYHVQAKYDQPWYRNSPYTDIAKEVSLIFDNYETIEVTNDLRPLYSYFVMENLISINDLQTNPHARDNQTYQLGKFKINRNVCEFDEYKPGTLYIAETQCRFNKKEMSQLELVGTITYNDGVEVYELLQLAK